MEEQTKQTEEVKDTSKKPQTRKATYEELNNYCVQLSQQNAQLVEQLKRMNMSNLFRRLDYLFMVVQSKEAFDTGDSFYTDCISEIKEALTIVNDEAQGDTQKESN